MTVPDPAPERIARAASSRARIGYVSAKCVLFAVMLFTVLLALTGRKAVREILDSRAARMPLRAVLKMSVTDGEARVLASRIERESKGVRAAATGHEDARKQLALQETWMQKMPDVEIGRLPALLEINYPLVLFNAEKMRTFAAQIEKMPEVDYVAFNWAEYEATVQFAQNLRWYANMFALGFTAPALLAYLIVTALARALKGTHGPGRAMFYALMITGGGSVLAIASYRGFLALAGRLSIASPLTGHAELAPVSIAVTVACVAALFLLSLVIELKDVRFSDRAERRF